MADPRVNRTVARLCHQDVCLKDVVFVAFGRCVELSIQYLQTISSQYNFTLFITPI
jgi:hypothetical protein